MRWLLPAMRLIRLAVRMASWRRHHRYRFILRLQRIQHLTQTPLRPSAAASLTTTYNRICALHSSFPCSGFSRARAKEARYVRPICCGNQNVRRKLCAQGLGHLRWTALANLAEHGAFFTARHVLWRRWQIYFWPSQTRWIRADDFGPGSGAIAG